MSEGAGPGKEAAPLPLAAWPRVHPLGVRQELAAIGMFVKRDVLLQTRFKSSFATVLLETASNLVIYGMIATFGQGVPAVRAVAGNYVAFVVSGMVVNVLLATALAGPYQGLMESFWSNRVEVILASPLRLPVFLTGLTLGRFVDAAFRIAVYLVGGALLLGLAWPGALSAGALLAVLLPALVATTGLGLLAASTIYILDARGGQDPIRFVVETSAGLVAGVYVPLQVLPGWAQWVAFLIPHTYAFDGSRRALFGPASLPPLPIHTFLPLSPLAADVLILVVYAAIAFPLGWRIFQQGLHLARSNGRLSRWL